MKRENFRILMFYLIVVAAVVMLPATVSKMKLHQEPLPFAMKGSGSVEGESGMFGGLPAFVSVILGILLVVSVIYYFVTGGVRGILITAAFFLILFLIFTYGFKRGEFSVQPPPPLSGEAAPRPVKKIAATEPSHWFVYLVSFIICSFILVVCLLLWRWMRKRLTPEEMIAREARKTLDDLKAGADLKQGVIRCYFEMVKALAEYHNLHRSKTMTPREFEGYLAQAGFASGDIGRLSRLFEKVRYGGRDIGKKEEQEAVGCLETIIRYCEDVK